MVIFHSYVSLPEGNPKLVVCASESTERRVRTAGASWNGWTYLAQNTPQGSQAVEKKGSSPPACCKRRPVGTGNMCKYM